MNDRAPYTYQDLLETYAALGVGRGETVYVTSDLWQVRGYEVAGSRALLEAHTGALLELLGEEGTLCVPTASVHLCNTDIVFDPATTEGRLRGAISEHVRQLPGAKRSFHPFFSYAAVGRHAERITRDAPRGAFACGSPEYRMMELDALSLSIGCHPRRTCTTVHLVEQAAGVPYRYTKEFMQPVLRDGEVRVEPFYYFVYYLGSDVERDGNVKLFKRLDGKLDLGVRPLGRSEAYSYRMRAFFDAALAAFQDDIYVWCKQPPTERPWQE